MRLLSIFLLSLISLSAFCQSTFCDDKLAYRKQVETGFDAIYRNDMASALSISNKLGTQCASNPQTHLYEANYWWWQIISGAGTDENYTKMEACLEKALTKLPKGKSADAYTNEQLYDAIIIYSYKSRIKMFQGKYIKAIQNLNLCVDFLKLSFGKEKEDDLFKLTTGLYNYFIQYAYDTSVLARAYLIFLPGGDRAKGIAYLKEAVKSNDFIVSTEARYFLMKIYGETEDKPAIAASYAEELITAYPDNLLFRYYLHKMLLKSNYSDKAMKHLVVLQEAAKKGKPHAQHFKKLAEENYKTFYAKKE